MSQTSAASTSTDDEVIAQLASLTPLEYDRIRKEQAKALGVQLATLDAYVKATREEKNKIHSKSNTLPQLNLIKASDLKMQPIQWLWNGWLASGKLHILGGAPGSGKTTIAMALAATVTMGGRWPDGTKATQGNVLIWSGEDDPADTLTPRLALSGADLNKVYFIDGVGDSKESRSFAPAKDVPLLQKRMQEIGDVKLLIIDPIVSAVTGDSHKNAEVRRCLQPLVDAAEVVGCALLGVTHFSKGTAGRDPTERITGSLAFSAMARIVLIAAKHQKDGEDGKAIRLFCRSKSNIGRDDGGFEYELRQDEIPNTHGVIASCVLWGDAVEGAARDLLAEADCANEDRRDNAVIHAENFLTELLSDGAKSVEAIKQESKAAGISLATTRRAKENLKIESFKGGFNAGWCWQLPIKEISDLPENCQGVQEKPKVPNKINVGTFVNSEHLRENSSDNPTFYEVEI